MASDAAAAEPSSGDTQRPPRYAIGYALAPKKQQSFIQPSLVARAAARGMDLVPVDAARPLAKQGPFHLLINKLYGDGWRAQLEAFAARHPAVPVVDPPHAIDRLHNRISMLQVVSELDHAADKDRTFGILGQVIVYDAAALTDSGLLDGSASRSSPSPSSPTAPPSPTRCPLYTTARGSPSSACRSCSRSSSTTVDRRTEAAGREESPRPARIRPP